MTPPARATASAPSATYLGLAHRVLTPEEEAEWCRKLRSRNPKVAALARETLVRHNIRLVASIALKFRGRARHLSLEDLISHGMVGFLRALDDFDPSLGHRLSTYATWWCQHKIRRAIADTDALIRLPVHLQDTAGRARRASAKFVAREGREPTAGELAAITRDPARNVRAALAAPDEPSSLDRRIRRDDEESATFLDFISRDELSALDDMLMREGEDEAVTALLSLSERERVILTRRYWHGCTLGEVGIELGLSRERIRQIERDVLGRLRKRARLRARPGEEARP